MLEVDVHQFPEHVVRGLLDFLRDRRRRGRHAEAEVAHGRLGGGHGDRHEPAAPGVVEERAHVRIGFAVLERERDVIRPRDQPGTCRIIRRRDGWKCALADNDRVHELDGDMGRVGRCRSRAVWDQDAAARERAWQARASRS